MTRRVGAKGQVVLPKRLRERAGLSPGDEVDFDFDGSAVRVYAVGEPVRLRGRLGDLELVAELERDREAESKR